MLKRYAPQYVQFEDEPGIAYGAYGERFGNQFEELVSHLKSDDYSRRAVIAIWNANDLMQRVKCKDIPCTLSLQFLLRDDKLHMVTTMRSQDVWLGMPYDVFAFTSLQLIVAHELGVDAGHYVHNVGSIHLYEKNFKAAEEAMREWDLPSDYLSWESGCSWDEANRLVTIEDTVRRYPDGGFDLESEMCADITNILKEHWRADRRRS